MDKNIFIHFITIFYSTKSCNANAQRRVLVSLFYKTQTHSVRSGMNYFRVQARLFINFNSNIVEPRHTTTSLLRPYSLDSNVEIRLILIFIFFENHPLMRPPHFYDYRILWPNGGNINRVPL